MIEMQCVYCAVGTEYLHVPEVFLRSLKGLGTYSSFKVKVSRDRPRWPKGFRVG